MSLDPRKLMHRLTRPGSFAGNVTILAGGTAVAQAVTMAAYPILTRLFRVEDFGNLQIYASIMSFAVVVVSLRFELAVLLPEDDLVAAAVTAVGILSAFCTSVVTAIIALAISALGMPIGTIEPLRSFLWLVPIGMLAAGIYQVCAYWAMRRGRYGRVSRTRLVQAIAQVLTQVASGLMRVGLPGLLFADVIGRGAGGLGLARIAWRSEAVLFRQVTWKRMKSAISRYRAFPLLSSGSALINSAGFALPQIAIAAFYGPKVLGMVALVGRVLEVPTILVGQAVSQVYSTEAARLAASSSGDLDALFRSSVRRLAMIGAAPFLILIATGPWLFAFVFGAQWREAGVYASIVGLMHFVSFVTWPLIPTLTVLEKQGWQLAWDVSRLSATLAGIWVPWYFHLPARVAIAFYAATLLVGYLVHLALSRHAIRLHAKSLLPAEARP